MGSPAHIHTNQDHILRRALQTNQIHTCRSTHAGSHRRATGRSVAVHASPHPTARARHLHNNHTPAVTSGRHERLTRDATSAFYHRPTFQQSSHNTRPFTSSPHTCAAQRLQLQSPLVRLFASATRAPPDLGQKLTLPCVDPQGRGTHRVLVMAPTKHALVGAREARCRLHTLIRSRELATTIPRPHA